jgi:two-component system nitrogen regulation response regulator GlnG
MITIFIDDKDKKASEFIIKMLSESGYAINTAQEQDLIKVAYKDNIKDIVSLEDRIIELGESLYNEKKGALYKTILDIIERPLLEHILERTEGNQLKAARILGINRNTIRSKIKKLGIDVSRWKVNQ